MFGASLGLPCRWGVLHSVFILCWVLFVIENALQIGSFLEGTRSRDHGHETPLVVEMSFVGLSTKLAAWEKLS